MLEIKGKDAAVDKIISALIQVESGGGKNLIRHEKAYPWLYKPQEMSFELGLPLQVEIAQQRFSYGAMQCMGATARELGYRSRDLKDLLGVDGLIYGLKYLGKCMIRYPVYPDYIAAYNAGTVRKLPNGLYVNQEYVDKVAKHV